MDPKSAHEMRDRIVILDVREPFEFDAGAISGARHIPLDQLPLRLSELDSTAEVLAVCRTGARSEIAAHWLSSRGFTVHNLDGGLQAWLAAGLPVETPSGSEGRVV